MHPITRLGGKRSHSFPPGSTLCSRVFSQGPPDLWKYHQGTPLMAGTNAVRSPSSCWIDGAAAGSECALTAMMTKSCGPSWRASSVARGCVTSVLPSLRRVRPFAGIALRCGPRATQLTSASPVPASLAAMYPRGYMAAKLAGTGEAEVSCVARGPHLEAIRANGLTLRSEGKTLVTHPRATDDARQLGPQDFVIIAVKAHSLPAAAPSIQHLLGERTALVPALNGVPWWYFYKSGGQWENTRLQSVDPGGKLWDLLPPSRVVGCIVYPATDVVEPGVIEHTYSNRFDLGEPDGSKSERAQALSQLMIKAGLRAPVRPRIRENLWVKLWGNLSFNMICSLTRSPLDAVIANPETRALARAMMVEGQGVAEKLGVTLPLDVDARIAGAAEVGSHKPSTLVDLERGRPMEIDALLGAVVEMAHLASVPTPQCESVLALVRQLARSAGAYPEPARARA